MTTDPIAAARERCPSCNGRGYTRCDCWPGDCICGWDDEDCDACCGNGDADWDDSWEDDPNDH